MIQVYIIGNDPFHPLRGLTAAGVRIDDPKLKDPIVKEAIRSFPACERIKFRVVSVNVPIVTGNYYNLSIVTIALTDDNGNFLPKPFLKYHDFARPSDEEPENFLISLFAHLRDTNGNSPEETFSRINEYLSNSNTFKTFNHLDYRYVHWSDKRLTEPLTKARDSWTPSMI